MQDLKRLASYAAKGCRAELLRTAETLFGVSNDDGNCSSPSSKPLFGLRMKSLVYITGSITFADLEAGRVSDIDVLDAQVKNWLLRPAAHLAAMTPTIGEQYEHGMSLFALELMFFEPHGQYLGGNDSQGQSGKMFLLAFERFRTWLVSRKQVEADFGEEQAKNVRDWARNGLFHYGQIKDGLLVDIRHMSKGPFYKNPVWEGWLVDPWQLLGEMNEYFDDYIRTLRNPSTAEDQQLIGNFKKTFRRLITAPDGAT